MRCGFTPPVRFFDARPGRRARDVSLLAVAVVVAGIAAPGAARAQSLASWEPPASRQDAFPLTIESIMRGSELIGQSPVGVRWSDDGRRVYFRWRPGGDPWHADRELYRVSADGGEPEMLDEETEERLAPLLAPGDVSPDRAWRAVSSGGDLYLIERATGDVRRLTHTTEFEGSPEFTGDGEGVFFQKDGNLFRFGIADGAIRQLTRVASGPEPDDEPEPEGHRAFLEEQQRELFEHIRIREAEREEAEAERERREDREPATTYLAAGERARSFDADPTGRYVLLTASKQPQSQERTDIPRWITDTGYTENTEMRAKVGDDQGASRLALIEVETGEATWLDLVPGGAEDEAAVEEMGADESAEEAEPTQGEGELAVSSFLGWDDSGSHGLIMAVDYDFKEWRLYALEAATGALTLLDSHQDEAWVGGPCFPNFGGGCAGWIPGMDGEPRAWYVSEATGWAHLYSIDADGTDRRALTSGEWEVRDATIPDGRDSFLLHTSEISPHDTHPWRMDFDGGNRVQLLEGPGAYDVTPSPDGSRFAVVHSKANLPPELYLADAEAGASLARVTVSPTGEWSAYEWRAPEIIRFEARDGTRVPARIYRPPDFGVPSNGAGVVFVHGAGYLQNVHNWWSNYYREYMFHHFLAAQGYTVLDIDYRGSAGYGRDWRTAIYRHMGGWDLSDQVDGAAYLVAEEGVDPDRLGIYGGSYGGFITLMALFTEPEVFEAGAALRSVTDWAHYNHWYTSRILNLPHVDEEAYRQSSPIYFAEGLEGHLLIAHGMYDTNVHFSDVVRLAQRLIELGKENWEMAVYPVENHSFVEPTSWTDEYRRIYELFENVIGTGYPATQGEGG